MNLALGDMSVNFLSTPSARRATASASSLAAAVALSIHALREEGDKDAVDGKLVEYWLSIHALREEGDRVQT